MPLIFLQCSPDIYSMISFFSCQFNFVQLMDMQYLAWKGLQRRTILHCKHRSMDTTEAPRSYRLHSNTARWQQNNMMPNTASSIN